MSQVPYGPDFLSEKYIFFNRLWSLYKPLSLPTHPVEESLIKCIKLVKLFQTYQKFLGLHVYEYL